MSNELDRADTGAVHLPDVRAAAIAPAADGESLPQPSPRRRRRTSFGLLLGIAPFFLFATLFLILPTGYLFLGAFRDGDGNFTLHNFARLAEPNIASAYWLSIKLSATSAAIGGVFGALLAWAVVMGGLPRWLKPVTSTFSGVASNFAGIPLAFAFLATLGPVGLITMLWTEVFGFRLYGTGFTILSFWGLVVTYLYFQIPLMLLILAPALEGMKREWREAAETLGASGRVYWLRVGLPVLWPSILGTILLLFANSFGAIATAYALTGSSQNIITILLFAQIRGNVLYDPNLGYALAVGMVVITGLTSGAYIWLRRRSERWLS
jgi:putative spermidine/putrescine transport system permease protein